MTMVNLAAYPLIVRTLEDAGPDATREQLRKNVILLLVAGLPIATIFIVLSSEISTIFLGTAFRQTGSDLMPWFAIAALLSSLRAYYFDLAFYLGKRTKIQVVVMVSALALNIVLNFLLIPNFGLFGAVIASVCAHGLAITLSAVVGRRAFLLPSVYKEVSRLLLASLAMAIALRMIPSIEGLAGLTLSTTIGVSVYLCIILVLDIGGARAFALSLQGQISDRIRRG